MDRAGDCKLSCVVLLVFALSLSIVSCWWNSNDVRYTEGKTPIVEIDTDVLYAEDIEQVLPLGLSPQDSMLFAQQYIKNWAQDVLFYQNAIRNIPDTKDVDKLVENYRRSLFQHEYQRRLVTQKFSSSITDEQIEQFYHDNSRLFELNEPLIKGLYLKIPNTSHDLDEIRRLYANMDDESFEEIEKYSIRNAAHCEFFYDSWRTVAEVTVMLPSMDETLESLLQNKQNLEFADEEYIYLLNVSEFVPKGGIEPLDHARANIRDLLINSNEVSYIRQIKEELYDAALQKSRIVFHQINKQ